MALEATISPRWGSRYVPAHFWHIIGHSPVRVWSPVQPQPGTTATAEQGNPAGKPAPASGRTVRKPL